MSDLLVATTKIHLPDEFGGAYLNPGDPLPAGIDSSSPGLQELVNFGSLSADAEPRTDGPTGNITQILAHIKLSKYEGGNADERAADPNVDPDDVHESEDNLLMLVGADALWDGIQGRAVAAFNNANSRLSVGDSTTAAASNQTDLQAVTNKLRKLMDAGFPTHTGGTAVSVYQSTFATTDANWAWQEWGIHNAAAAGVMLNRKVESLGTKTSAAAWVLAVTLTLA